MGVNSDLACYNLFAYCGNNPINRYDASGYFWKTLKKIGQKIVEGAVAALTVVATAAAVVGTAALIIGTGGAAAAVLAPAIAIAAEALAVTATVATATAVVGVTVATVGAVGESVTYAKKSPTSRNQMQEQVKRGQAPKNVDRVDKPHVNAPNQQNHVHFKDGTALNMDGSISHESKGVPNITDTIFKWLVNNGWGVPHV